jgi:hypothetical protein
MEVFKWSNMYFLWTLYHDRTSGPVPRSFGQIAAVHMVPPNGEDVVTYPECMSQLTAVTEELIRTEKHLNVTSEEILIIDQQNPVIPVQTRVKKFIARRVPKESPIYLQLKGKHLVIVLAA